MTNNKKISVRLKLLGALLLAITACAVLSCVLAKLHADGELNSQPAQTTSRGTTVSPSTPGYENNAFVSLSLDVLTITVNVPEPLSLSGGVMLYLVKGNITDPEAIKANYALSAAVSGLKDGSTVDLDGLFTSHPSFNNTVAAELRSNGFSMTAGYVLPNVPSAYYDYLTAAVYVPGDVQISFRTNGGNELPSMTVNYGTVPQLPTPTREGYTFRCWYLPDGNQYSGQAITVNTVLSAAWQVNKYTVTFDTDGGTAISPKTYSYGAALGELPVPSREGYIFSHWRYLEDSHSPLPETVVTSNLTLLAVWTANSYTLTFDAAGGELNAALIWNVSRDSFVTLPIPSREGYIFVGWLSDGVKAEPEIQVTENMVFTASWEIIRLSVGFTYAGETVATVTVDYGSTYAQAVAMNGALKAMIIISDDGAPLPTDTAIKSDVTLKVTPKTIQVKIIENGEERFQDVGYMTLKDYDSAADCKYYLFFLGSYAEKYGYYYCFYHENAARFDTYLPSNLTYSGAALISGESEAVAMLPVLFDPTADCSISYSMHKVYTLTLNVNINGETVHTAELYGTAAGGFEFSLTAFLENNKYKRPDDISFSGMKFDNTHVNGLDYYYAISFPSGVQPADCTASIDLTYKHHPKGFWAGVGGFFGGVGDFFVNGWEIASGLGSKALEAVNGLLNGVNGVVNGNWLFLVIGVILVILAVWGLSSLFGRAKK